MLLEASGVLRDEEMNGKPIEKNAISHGAFMAARPVAERAMLA